MTKEPIIIDDVDVKDCKRRIGKDNYCRYYKRPCAENNYNCIWKKYLRKEQECDQLRETIKLQNEMQKEVCEEKNKEIDKLKAENDDLKIYIESNEQQVKEVEKLVMDNDRLINERNQYKLALQEIKEIVQNRLSLVCKDCVLKQCKTCEAKQILQKCEVLND